MVKIQKTGRYLANLKFVSIPVKIIHGRTEETNTRIVKPTKYRSALKYGSFM